MRQATGADFPVTARLGVADVVEGGLSLPDGLAIARQLAAEGLDGLEVTYGVMTSYRENIRPYAGVDRWRAIADGMLHRSFSRPVAEAYYRPFARAAKAAVDIPVILVGGLRSTQMMDDIVRSATPIFWRWRGRSFASRISSTRSRTDGAARSDAYPAISAFYTKESIRCGAGELPLGC